MREATRNVATTLAPEMNQRELALLRRWLSQRRFPGKHLEIGTAAGGTLCEMLRALLPQPPPFVVVDPMTYFPNQRQTVERNLAQHGFSPNQVEFRQLRSWDAYRRARDAGESFDFVVIDAAHKFRYVIQDLHWANLTNVGGLIALHDYTTAMRGVVWAVDTFLWRNPNYRRAEQAGTLLILEKWAPDGPGGVRLLPGALAALIQPALQLEVSVRKRLRRWTRPPGR